MDNKKREAQLKEISEVTKSYLEMKGKYDVIDVYRDNESKFKILLSEEKFKELFKGEDDIIDCVGTTMFRFRYFKMVSGIKYYCLSEKEINFRD